MKKGQEIPISKLKSIFPDQYKKASRGLAPLKIDNQTYYYSIATLGKETNIITSLFIPKQQCLFILKEGQFIGYAVTILKEDFPLKNKIPKLQKQIDFGVIKNIGLIKDRLKISFRGQENDWEVYFCEQVTNLNQIWGNLITQQIRKIKKQLQDTKSQFKDSQEFHIKNQSSNSCKIEIIKEDVLKDERNEDEIVQNCLNYEVKNNEALQYLKNAFKIKSKKITLQDQEIHLLKNDLTKIKEINKKLEQEKDAATKERLLSDEIINQKNSQIEKLKRTSLPDQDSLYKIYLNDQFQFDQDIFEKIEKKFISPKCRSSMQNLTVLHQEKMKKYQYEEAHSAKLQKKQKIKSIVLYEDSSMEIKISENKEKSKDYLKSQKIYTNDGDLPNKEDLITPESQKQSDNLKDRSQLKIKRLQEENQKLAKQKQQKQIQYKNLLKEWNKLKVQMLQMQQNNSSSSNRMSSKRVTVDFQYIEQGQRQKQHYKKKNICLEQRLEEIMKELNESKKQIAKLSRNLHQNDIINHKEAKYQERIEKLEGHRRDLFEENEGLKRQLKIYKNERK